MGGEYIRKHWGVLAALGLTLVFAAVNLWVLYYKGNFAVTLVPLALLVVWLFVRHFETGLLAMALLTPFSINAALLPGMELSMPVEPMMILFTLVFLFRVLVMRPAARRGCRGCRSSTCWRVCGLCCRSSSARRRCSATGSG